MSQQQDRVPGTIHLVNTNAHDIVLHPQPSSDPEDPLNWSLKRKRWAASMVYIYLLGIGIATTVQYSVISNISDETGISVADLDTGTGLMFLFLGWGCLIWQPIALVFGRRGVLILSSLLSIGPMVWTVYSHSPGVWYLHRILLGVLAAPCESLPEIAMADICFAHERGLYIGIYALFLFGSNAIAPLLAGFITHGLGWRAAIWFGTIVLACTTVVIFFGLEETMYFRQTVEGIEEEDSVAENSLAGEKEEKSPVPRIGTPATTTTEPQKYVQKLKLFRNMAGRPSVKQMLVMMYRPLVIFLYFPNISSAGFLYGSNLSWYLVVNGTMSAVLSGEPYNFAANMAGLAYVSPLIRSFVGAIWTGWVGDKVALYLARRNGGIREPEHRLWILIGSALIGAAGFLLWRVGAARQINSVAIIVGTGMVMATVTAGGSVALAYGVDCFKEISGEAMMLIIVIRNTIGFGFSYGITPWLNAQGYVKTFVAVAMLSLGFTLTFLIFVFWGKSLRRTSAKKHWQYVQTLVVPGKH
ncbi:hypothetical protein UA08_07368 [Talaromyces atroroseus]|uniref:Major facilitator superfamily (MFS) profile domain-containing protein n=1 Tax=Talaromyces atroroseus TaxID=1441469 RepID=A0A225A935_TALAT|nr:hypothetical protein UA08_07368 [Talaromyces atroroseus]OKL57212.1 hypothetical protein UA08_07368 [Talaromyces atroroseus]